MTEFLIGMVIGVIVCWAVLHVTDVWFERRQP